MGPTLNVAGLLRLPYGCGEQNMVNFAPGIYIMQYLSAVGQLTTSVENKAKNVMTTGKIVSSFSLLVTLVPEVFLDFSRHERVVREPRSGEHES